MARKGKGQGKHKHCKGEPVSQCGPVDVPPIAPASDAEHPDMLSLDFLILTFWSTWRSQGHLPAKEDCWDGCRCYF